MLLKSGEHEYTCVGEEEEQEHGEGARVLTGTDTTICPRRPLVGAGSPGTVNCDSHVSDRIEPVRAAPSLGEIMVATAATVAAASRAILLHCRIKPRCYSCQAPVSSGA